ncbi:MAG: cytochrome c [Gammaproteobacteria bacterium]|nr:cytochrome c [Gammaproteobacteria bacterium]
MNKIIITFALLFAFIGTGTAIAAEKPLKSLPFKYAKGQNLFNKNCSSCHGTTLLGSETGPPLLHNFYKPSHHGDSSFYRAALSGVRAHHWSFGDMPPVPEMTQKKLNSIVPYIRYFQQQKGLF